MRDLSWFWIVVAFMVFPPAGFVFLFLKMFSNGQSRGNTARRYHPPQQRHAYPPPSSQRQAQSGSWDWRQNAQNVEAQPVREEPRQAQAQTASPPRPSQTAQQRAARSYQPGKQAGSAPPRPSAQYNYSYNYSYDPQAVKSVRLQRKISSKQGLGLIITGGIFLGIGALVASILFLVGLGSWDLSFAVGSFAIAMISGGLPGLAFLIPGKRLRDRALRCQTLYTMMQSRKVADIREMAAAVPCSYAKACDDLRWMIHEGFFPGAYIDASKGMLIYAGNEPDKPKATAPEAEPKEPPKKPGVFAEVERIRQLNDEIADAFVSERMDRLEELSHKILTYVEANPGKEDRIRQFKQHYLPKTIKILESYARFERQGVQGANIRAAMKDVEEIMDTLVNGFEKQLDMLFVDEALDVTTDINVLESMMGIQGLSSDDPFKLELLGEDLV